jgi:small subunit ribosomal protein S13
MADKKEEKYEKEKSDAAAKEKAPPPRKVEKNIKGIKRIAGKDVSGDYKLMKALLRVRGIGTGLNGLVAKLIAQKLNISPKTEVGDLNDEQIEKIDALLANLGQHEGIPAFMLNRQKDYLEGGNKHVIMNDLIFANRQDIDKEKNAYSWKGYRHAYGQKTRGQRTRNTGRVGMTVGVLRKAILAQTKGAGAPTAGAAQAASGKVPAAAGGAAAKPAAPAKK